MRTQEMIDEGETTKQAENKQGSGHSEKEEIKKVLETPQEAAKKPITGNTQLPLHPGQQPVTQSSQSVPVKTAFTDQVEASRERKETIDIKSSVIGGKNLFPEEKTQEVSRKLQPPSPFQGVQSTSAPSLGPELKKSATEKVVIPHEKKDKSVLKPPDKQPAKKATPLQGTSSAKKITPSRKPTSAEKTTPSRITGLAEETAPKAGSADIVSTSRSQIQKLKPPAKGKPQSKESAQSKSLSQVPPVKKPPSTKATGPAPKKEKSASKELTVPKKTNTKKGVTDSKTKNKNSVTIFSKKVMIETAKCATDLTMNAF
uniref:Microtubule-associated protein n=1 Tax=Angiostrongylus cantonensis TaxID=6313 RepID=A0A0K0D2Z8_ANGCA